MTSTFQEVPSQKKLHELVASDFVLSKGWFKSGGQWVKSDTVTISPATAPGILVIHASWCGHCVRLMPTYKDLTSMVHGPQFNCFAIENEQLGKDPGLAKALGVQYFPTIKFFDAQGRVTKTYDGGREIQNLLDAVCDHYHNTRTGEIDTSSNIGQRCPHNM